MRYLSVCTGIGGAEAGFAPLGWEPVAFAEVDPFCRAVLRHRFPGVPNLGDFTKITAEHVGAVDLVVGGTPCQDFSVAGLRAGLAGARGALTVEFCRLLGRVLPRWVVWENVPGVLSADGGRAFGVFLGLLGELGYSVAWRVLDAQHFGVPQRRRRVFLVGHLGADWRPPAAVLFERHSLSGHPPPRREAGQRTADSLTVGANQCSGRPGDVVDVAHALTADMQRLDAETETFVAHSLRADGFDASEDGTGRGVPLVPIDLRQASRGEKITNNRANGSGGPPGHGVGDAGDPAFTVSERGQAVAYQCQGTDVGEMGTLRSGNGHGVAEDVSHTLDGANGQAIASDSTWSGDFGVQEDVSVPLKDGHGTVPAVAFGFSAGQSAAAGSLGWRAEQAPTIRGGASGINRMPTAAVGAERMTVRRLTPLECERLMGLPDGWTDVPYRSKPAKDGNRYRALGNGMVVNVMAWVGRRIALVEALL